MKVGILTFHDADNYGAVLQCYALQESIKKMGHHVEVINYQQKHIESLYESRTHISVMDFIKLNPLAIKSAIKKLLQLSDNKKKHESFNQFRHKHLNLSEKCFSNNIPEDFDAYVIGSDQMWSYACCGGIDPVYWGSFNRNNDSSLIGYAISGNGDFAKYISEDKIREHCEMFTALSFREKALKEIVQKAAKCDFPITLDPTLLSDENIWIPLLSDKWRSKKYVVVYQARVNKSDPSMIMKRAKDYAKMHNLEVLNLSSGKYSINDFLSAIKFSDCVFTSSFHATVFSLLFGTPFYSFMLEDGRDGRYVNLLEELQMTNHLVTANDSLYSKEVIDRDELSIRLNHLRQDSLSFLQSYLKID